MTKIYIYIFILSLFLEKGAKTVKELPVADNNYYYYYPYAFDF